MSLVGNLITFLGAVALAGLIIAAMIGVVLKAIIEIERLIRG